ICDVPISFVQATLGAELNVPTLEGKAQIKIPAGTQNGSVFRLRGKGVKNVHGHGHGDLHVRVAVEVPTHLNAAQKAKLQEFAEMCDENVNPISRGFFAKARNLPATQPLQEESKSFSSANVRRIASAEMGNNPRRKAQLSGPTCNHLV